MQVRFWSGICCGLLAACGGSGSSAGNPDPPPPQPQPITFHCADDSTCPELGILGDPAASDAFRGYGDPSLEYDADTGTLWLTYSWLNVMPGGVGPPIDNGVHTHLARSDDNGLTFRFVRGVNPVESEPDPVTGLTGWSTYEVPTIVKDAQRQWQLLSLRYHSKGTGGRDHFRFERTVADDPAMLGDTRVGWIRGAGLDESIPVAHDLSLIPGLSDCFAFTEPDLYSESGATYLATHCIVVDAQGERRPDLERLVLLREEASGYSFLGNLLTAADAADRNVDTLEQVDVSRARDGSLILLATPIDHDAATQHQGCVAFEIEDLAAARIRRDGSGNAVLRAVITADGSGLGPGLCTYHANSETGILLVIVDVRAVPFDARFSLRATGVHP
jgi:hypothetical protein